MKSICLSMLLIFSITSAAQVKTLNTSSGDLKIVKARLASIGSVNRYQKDPPPKLDDSHFEWNPPSSQLQGKAELEVQNNGSKSIKSIDWTLLLILDANSRKTIEGYAVRSNREIRPGETVKVTSRFTGANLEKWRKPLKDGLFQTQAQIKQINYTDGSIWVP
jgi:hypothetical protein